MKNFLLAVLLPMATQKKTPWVLFLILYLVGTIGMIISFWLVWRKRK